MWDITRTRWAAIGAAVAVSLGAGGIGLGQAAIGTGDKPVYVALDAPCRLVDTRPASVIGPKNTPIAAGDAAAYEIQVTGDSGQCTGALAVPADASAVALNVTAIAPVATATGRSFFTVYPADASRPGTSNLNFLNGAPPTPNKVDVGLSGDGKIKIYNNEGTAHAAVDIFGYYIDHHHDDRYYTQSEVDAALATKADDTAVYTMDEAYDLFAPQWLIAGASLGIRASSPGLETTQIFRPPSDPIGIYCIVFPDDVSIERHAIVGTVEDYFGGEQDWGISINTTINTECSEGGAQWDITVKTTNSGARADAGFRLLLPRSVPAP